MKKDGEYWLSPSRIAKTPSLSIFPPSDHLDLNIPSELTVHPT